MVTSASFVGPACTRLHDTASVSAVSGQPGWFCCGYDQLNRLLSGQRSTYTAGSQTWSTAAATSPYSSRYTYDANGNLQTLGRNTGTSSQLLDDLTYRYDPANANRLKWVTDKVAATRSAEDVDNQAIDNYNYDEVGNLISDAQAGVGAIAWTPYGKISSVTRFPLAAGGDKPFTAYVYDAQGNRISKATGVTGATTSTTATTYYVRDAQGNPLAVYERQTPAGGPATLRLREQALYGSARLGLRQPNLTLAPGQALPAATGYYARVLGQKAYELTDHLGNVRAVVSDQKTSTLGTGGTPLASSLRPVLGSYYNYYPFGQLQPGRYAPSNATATGGYRYGYNGKEKDNNGELGLTTYDYGFRIYNPGLGRFLSVDPLAKAYPWNSSYAFAENDVIRAVDLDGLEKYIVTVRTFLPYNLVVEPIDAYRIDEANVRTYAQLHNVGAHGGYKTEQKFNIDFDKPKNSGYERLKVPVTYQKHLAKRQVTAYSNPSDGSTKGASFDMKGDVATGESKQAASNPALHIMDFNLPGLAPTIDYDLKFNIKKDGNYTFDINFDGFPGMEVFLEDVSKGTTDLIFLSTPFDAGTTNQPRGLGLLGSKLFPYFGDI